MPKKIALLLFAALVFGSIGNAGAADNKSNISPAEVRKGLADLFTPGMFIGAAQRGETDFMKQFLAGEMDINVRLKDTGDTALMLAAKAGHLDTVVVLIEYGADVNFKNMDGETALSLSEKNKFGDIANALVRAGATQ
jgi:ankyrin repeat protein